MLNGPPSDREALQQVPGVCVNLSGIAGLIYATRRASAIIGVDSGPMHLAAALAKPGVAIFGPTDPQRNGPYGGSMQVLTSARASVEVRQRGDYTRGSVVDQSMRDVSPAQVVRRPRASPVVSPLMRRYWFPKPYADQVARMRVPSGFLLVALFAWLSHPTRRSLLIGFPVSMLGLLLRGWAAGHLAKNRNSPNPDPTPTRAIPLYIGTLLVACGLVLAGRSIVLAAVFAAVFLLVYLPVIELEEQHLRELFPAYDEFAAPGSRPLAPLTPAGGDRRFSPPSTSGTASTRPSLASSSAPASSSASSSGADEPCRRPRLPAQPLEYRRGRARHEQLRVHRSPRRQPLREGFPRSRQRGRRRARSPVRPGLRQPRRGARRLRPSSSAPPPSATASSSTPSSPWRPPPLLSAPTWIAGPAALLFGSEKFGLSNEDMSFCHSLIRIPTVPETPSMNLGQSVAVCLYELVRTAPAAPDAVMRRPVSGADAEQLTRMLLESLEASGYTNRIIATSTEQKVRRFLRRICLEQRDARLVLGILRQFLWKMREGRMRE